MFDILPGSDLLLLRNTENISNVLPELSFRNLWWCIFAAVCFGPCVKFYLDRRRRNELLWKLPGCNVNYVFLYLAIARSIVLKNLIKTNILSFQVLCGTSILFYKKKIWRMWIGLKPVVVFFMPETVEVILSSNTILKKTFMYDFLNYWFKEGLITSSGWKWRERRKLLTPAFHFRILGDFQPIIDDQSRILVHVLREKAQTGEAFDVVSPITHCTLDILCETAMGKKMDAQRTDSEYVEALKVASERFCDRVMKPWVWPDFTYFLSSEGRMYKRNVNIMQKFTTNVIKERKKELIEQLMDENAEEMDEFAKPTQKRKAFLDLLLYHHIKEGLLSEEDIREEVDTFMFAGHDTTAMGISWAVYCIGLYTEVQDLIHEELDRIFGDDKDRPITIHDLRDMKYLECVLKESQRLFPSLPVIGRELEEDVIVEGHVIPKGTTCMLATYMLHRNPDTFPNPEAFDPDRFLPENCVGRHPYAYVPFSAGPRNCIGQRFAMMEEKTVVANILRHYTIRSIQQRDCLQLTAEMVLRNHGGIWIEISHRNP